MQSSFIRIGARTYSVALLDDADFDLLLAQQEVIDSEIKSFIDYDEQLIIVRARLCDDHKRELVLHELIHACLEDSGACQNEVTEAFVSVMAPRLNLAFDDIQTVLGDLGLKGHQ